MTGNSSGTSLSLTLASASPRRRLLLPLLGFPVIVAPSDVDEQPFQGEPAHETAVRLADEKASVNGPTGVGEVAVGADTIVVLHGKQLGKPGDADEARKLLRALRGRAHEVVTGVALHGAEQSYRRAVTSVVRMRAYSDDEIVAFVASGRPLDKAGGYAIQDAQFAPVQAVEGCYLSVVGLPLCEVARGLRALGWPLPPDGSGPGSTCRWCVLGRTALEAAR
jgi:MAF protein